MFDLWQDSLLPGESAPVSQWSMHSSQPLCTISFILNARPSCLEFFLPPTLSFRSISPYLLHKLVKTCQNYLGMSSHGAGSEAPIHLAVFLNLSTIADKKET